MKKTRAARASSRRPGSASRMNPPARAASAPVPPSPSAPYLIVRDAARAIDFYKRAFDAVEVVRLVADDGRIAHCELKLGDATILLADEWEGVGATSPASLGGSPVVIHVEVDDVDKMARRAIDAGASMIFPIADRFYGARDGRLRDPFGHMWILSTPIANKPEKEKRGGRTATTTKQLRK